MMPSHAKQSQAMPFSWDRETASGGKNADVHFELSEWKWVSGRAKGESG